MSQPQEQSTPALAISKLVATHEEVIGQLKDLPNHKILKAQEKFDLFRTLKGEIDDHLTIIHEQMNFIKEKIKNSVNTLLKYSVEEYMDYLRFDYVNFENLLR